MAWTAQEAALAQVKEKYGPSGFTRNHLNYRLVGYSRGGVTISAIGSTWDEAMAELGKRARW